MFLEWANKLDLLAHNPDSNILGGFSLSVRKILVDQVVSSLVKESNGAKLLSSANHVRWAMEVCGQGFGLPIEDEDIIVKCISLYSSWALEPKKRPPAISETEESEQFFLQRILEQYSVLFTPRQHAPAVADRHASLCSSVLDIYANIAKQLNKKLTIETWTIFLKLLICIADSILLNVPAAGLDALQKKLSGQVLKVLFELFLLSGMEDQNMWLALHKCVVGWTRHRPLIATWKVVITALTKRTLAILYGPSEGTDSISIKIDDAVHSIDPTSTFCFYSWHRVLNILGNPNETITSPDIFLGFVKGVEMLVNQFLKIGLGSKNNSRNLPPDGNTILHIFGKWLIDAVLSDRPTFDEGNALAMTILCNIMTTKNATQFVPHYIASFCVCLQKCLLKEGRLLISAIVNATKLFSTEIKGIRSLVPAYVYACHRVLAKRVANYDHILTPDRVREQCIKIIAHIICLPNHLAKGNFLLRLKEKAARPFDVSTYEELKPHISIVLIEALTNETLATNISLLLHLSYTWLIEDIEHNSDFMKQAITLIIRKVTSHVAWPTEVTLVALEVMSAMSRLWPKLSVGTEQANFIVCNLCKYVSSQSIAASRFPGKDEKEVELLVAQSFHCIGDWLMVEQWLLSYPETLNDLLKSVVIGMTGRKGGQAPVASSAGNKKGHRRTESREPKNVGDSQISDKIKEAANTTLLSLMNHTGNFPTASGPATVSTLLCEEDILSEIADSQNSNENPRQFMRYFITHDRVIICAIDRPPSPEEQEAGIGPKVVLLLRDKTGKYAWETNLRYLADKVNNDHPELEEDTVAITTTPFKTEEAMEIVTEDRLGGVLSFLKDRHTNKCIDITTQQASSEDSHLESKQYNLDTSISVIIPSPSDAYQADCKLQQSRLLLSHLGYLSLENRGRLYQLDMSSGFFNSLKRLDQLSERSCVSVGVVFGRVGDSIDTMLAYNGGTLDFQEFVASLGWGINLETHTGYMGGLSSDGSTGDVAPYWSNFSHEVMFLVAPLMDNASTSRRAELVHSTEVVIVWTEDTKYNPQTIWAKTKNNNLQIVIIPLKNGTYLVRICHRNLAELKFVGPLFNGIMLSKHILGTLSRETAIRAHKRSKEKALSQFQVRDQFIEDIFQKYKKETSLEEFFASLFTNIPDDKLIGSTASGEGAIAVRKAKRKARKQPPPPTAVTPEKEASSTAFTTAKKDDKKGGFGGRIAPSRPSNSNVREGSLRMGNFRGSKTEDGEEKKKKSKKDREEKKKSKKDKGT